MIPRQLHCCWLVDEWKPSREPYLKSWAALGWPVTLWYSRDEQNVPSDIVTTRKVHELFRPTEAWNYELRHENHGALADLFRYEVLYQLGGGYFDVDCLPLLDLDTWAEKGDLWVSQVANFFIPCETRFMMSSPGHPLIAKMRAVANTNTLTYIAAGGHAQGVDAKELLKRTGPHCAMRVLDKETGNWRNFGIPNPTNDRTPENVHEHFHEKFGRIDEIAGYTSRRRA